MDFKANAFTKTYKGFSATFQTEIGTNKVYVSYFRPSGRKVNYVSKNTLVILKELIKKAEPKLKKDNLILWSY